VSTAAPTSQIKPVRETKESSPSNDGVSLTSLNDMPASSADSDYAATKTADSPSSMIKGGSAQNFGSEGIEGEDPTDAEDHKAEIERLRIQALAKLTVEQTAVLRVQFKYIDVDGSGIITKKELSKAMEDLGVYATAAAREVGVSGMLKSLDKDGSAEVDEDEFIAMMAMNMNNGMTDEDIRGAFHAFDADGSGLVSRAELKEAFSSLGTDFMAEEEILQMMNMFDTDGDGQIDITEFTKVIKKVA